MADDQIEPVGEDATKSVEEIPQPAVPQLDQDEVMTELGNSDDQIEPVGEDATNSVVEKKPKPALPQLDEDEVMTQVGNAKRFIHYYCDFSRPFRHLIFTTIPPGTAL